MIVRSSPVSAHAISQFRLRIMKIPPEAATEALRVLAARAREKMEHDQIGPQIPLTLDYEGHRVVVVVRDGYLVTCWKEGGKEG